MTSPENTQAILDSDRAKALSRQIFDQCMWHMERYQMWHRVPTQTRLALMDAMDHEISVLVNEAFKTQ